MLITTIEISIKPTKMLSGTSGKMAILVSIEKVLMETGSDYGLVLTRLQANNLTLLDYCVNAKYLNDVLIDVFGNRSKEIVDKITENLECFDDSDVISRFLLNLRSYG